MQAYVEEITVKPTSTGGNNYRMKLDGKWLSAGFAKPACNVGDQIEYTTVQKGQYTNLGSIHVLQAGAAPPVVTSAHTGASGPSGSRERSIVRQNSVTNAVAVYNSYLATKNFEVMPSPSPVERAQEILVVARIFEMYSMQDMDVTALNEKLAALLGGTEEE